MIAKINMEHQSQDAPVTALTLPLTVVSLIDLGRLQRELQAVEVFLSQAAAREPGKSLALPRTTHNLEATAHANKLNLLVKEDRQKMTEFLQMVREKAPHVQISFASDPSAAFLQKIVSWFRTTIHPLVILQVGLQPTIAAGCILRTNNKYFDLSLRKFFKSQRPVLVDKIRQSRTDHDVMPPKVEQPVVSKNPDDLKEYVFAKPEVAATPAAPAPPAQEQSHG